jgi:two-component system, sensor histidine kinase and response regulator
MTAHAFRQEFDMSLQSGMDDHLTKPISAEDLLSVVAKWAPKDMVRNAAMSQGFGAEAKPVINTEEAMARIDGNLELYIKILKIYKNNLPPPQEIIEHFKQGDVQTARREAHTVKGMSAQIGASGLHGIAAVLEEAIRSGDESNVEKHAVLFVQELEKVFACIDRFVRSSECIN